MTPPITTIANLTRYSNFSAYNITIKASVMIKSIKHSNPEHVYFYFDLSDDTGEISAVAYDEAAEKFFKAIEENYTYIISNFGLCTSDRGYTSNEHPKEIVLRAESTIECCGKVPRIDWCISSLNLCKEEEQDFINIIGMCIGVSDTDSPPGKLVRRVRLMDEKGNQATLAVWNSETFIFDDLDLHTCPVFLVIDARFHHYDGMRILTTSRYLQLLDPSDPRACRVKNALARIYTAVDE